VRSQISLVIAVGLGILVSPGSGVHGQTSGTIAAWGRNSSGQCNVPAPNANFVAVAAGRDHSLGLKSDGTIVGWGDNNYGQCAVPAPNADFVAVAAGTNHSLGVKSDGQIVAWGWNVAGQCNVPLPNADFVAVSGGEFHSLGLKSDGTIVGWGWNGDGQCTIPLPNADFVAVAAGLRHSLGLKSNGTIITWGSNDYGQCNVPAPNEGFVALAAGGAHSLGLKSDGTIVTWGDNSYGQCNVPMPNVDFAAISSALREHSLGLKLDGRIVAWGWNDDGQCNVPEPNADFVGLAGGYFHSLGLKRSPTTCAVPEIISRDPSVVNTANCSGGCKVSFSVSTEDDYSQVQKITLERSLPGLWVEEDAILAPIPDPDWTLTCEIDGHYTDGPHTFRAVFHCQDGSKSYSFPVFVTAERGVPVLISGFEAEHSEGGVQLRWSIAEGVRLQGFNIYRSLERTDGFERINEQLISADQGNEYVDRDAGTGETYWYRLGAMADDGEWMSQTVSIVVPAGALALHQNVPNPFNPSTTISFTLPERERLSLSIYDVKGRLVKTLVDETVDGGYQERVWEGKDANGSPVGSGVYFYRLTAADKTLTKKMVIVR